MHQAFSELPIIIYIINYLSHIENLYLSCVQYFQVKTSSMSITIAQTGIFNENPLSQNRDISTAPPLGKYENWSGPQTSIGSRGQQHIKIQDEVLKS